MRRLGALAFSSLVLACLLVTPARALVNEGPGTIAFTRTVGGNTDIYTVSGDGSGPGPKGQPDAR